jgi:GAF domain-containing protein
LRQNYAQHAAQFNLKSRVFASDPLIAVDAFPPGPQIATMFQLQPPDFSDKQRAYAELEQQLRALLHGERDFIANAANTAALLWHSLPDLNWAGFYRLAGNELVLGPFQGKPACVRIKLGKGVCGTAAAMRKTVLVPNVHEFPGHIACDAESKSEIVVPLVKDGQLLGVLDLDSPKLNRFDAADQAGLERLAAVLVAASA